MAIIGYEESFTERSVSGTVRESYKFRRPFYVRVDSPNTSLYDILSAPGINYFDPHPECAFVAMQNFDVSCADDSGLYYKVTFNYEAIKNEAESEAPSPTGLPPDMWSASGSVTTGPMMTNKDGDPILNTAGDAIEGLERDYAELRLSLTRCYASTSWAAVATAYTNTVNASTWNGGAARSWKVAFQSATKRVEVVNNTTVYYWETQWDFVYRAPNWDAHPLNVGMMEKVGGQKKMILADGEPVAQPVALNNDGTANPGGNPTALDVRVYPETNFSIWGTFA